MKIIQLLTSVQKCDLLQFFIQFLSIVSAIFISYSYLYVWKIILNFSYTHIAHYVYLSVHVDHYRHSNLVHSKFKGPAETSVIMNSEEPCVLFGLIHFLSISFPEMKNASNLKGLVVYLYTLHIHTQNI